MRTIKKIGSLLGNALVTGGMVYALIALAAAPAAACTPTGCATLQRVADDWCESLFCDGGGYVTFCNSNGFRIFCLHKDGAPCTSFSGQCSN